jgi:hypothetical protein
MVRKKQGRRKREAGSIRGQLRYSLGAIGPFGWFVVGLFVLWLGGLVLALVLPGLSRLLLVLGGGLVLVGNVWIGFVAYKDSQVFGMLCFFTCLFAYAYIFMNPDETWRPAALTGLGLLFTLSGLVFGA